jgi:hypothetical protein
MEYLGKQELIIHDFKNDTGGIFHKISNKRHTPKQKVLINLEEMKQIHESMLDEVLAAKCAFIGSIVQVPEYRSAMSLEELAVVKSSAREKQLECTIASMKKKLLDLADSWNKQNKLTKAGQVEAQCSYVLTNLVKSFDQMMTVEVP